MISEFCRDSLINKKRRQKFHQRKLELLYVFRDSLERRLSGINASINTLEEQINRDQASDLESTE